MRRVINALIVVDIGVIIFTILSENREWFINSQIGFISSSLVMFASIVSYRNMVKSRLDAGVIISDDNRDTIDKIEDRYDLYSEDKIDNIDVSKIIKDEKKRLKSSRSIWQVTKDSRASLSLYRLGAYALLILGFFYLNSNHILNIAPYLSSLLIPPTVVVIILLLSKP